MLPTWVEHLDGKISWDEAKKERTRETDRQTKEAQTT